MKRLVPCVVLVSCSWACASRNVPREEAADAAPPNDELVADRGPDRAVAPDPAFVGRPGDGLGTVIAADEVVHGLLVAGRPVAVPDATMAEFDRFEFEVRGRLVELRRDPATGEVVGTVDHRSACLDRTVWSTWKELHPTSLAVR